jgi:hypothetical protein
MTTISKSLCWAAVLIALALANQFGLITGKDVNLIYVLIPALWIATGGLSNCGWSRVAGDAA